MRLNHFYVNADEETFAAAARAAQLGAWEERTTVRKDRTYTGLYLYGENTYLELLHPRSKLGAPSGIAWEGRGGELIFRGEAPWFRMASPQPQLAALTDWTMEYVPEFFRQFHPQLPPANPGTSRADALTRYTAACGKLDDREQGLFEDVIGLELQLPAGDAAILAQRPRPVGIELQVREGSRGIAAARLRLRREAGNSNLQIGSTTLSLDGRTAVWRF